MAGERRSARQQPPDFVWGPLDSQPQESGAAPEGESAPVATEAGEPERDGGREPGARRATGRALIAAAVLVPLAGGSYALVAYSGRHSGPGVVSAGAPQASDLVMSGTASAADGPTHGAGPGSRAGLSPNSSTMTGLPAPAGRSATAPAGSGQAPSQAATTAPQTPGRTVAASTTAASGPTTVASKPSATAKPSATGSPAGHTTCATPWSSSVSYSPGQVVSYQGQNYTAIYYSTDAAPDAAISWNLWTSDGSCTS
jgi:hypothetical protein